MMLDYYHRCHYLLKWVLSYLKYSCWQGSNQNNGITWPQKYSNHTTHDYNKPIVFNLKSIYVWKNETGLYVGPTFVLLLLLKYPFNNVLKLSRNEKDESCFGLQTELAFKPFPKNLHLFWSYTVLFYAVMLFYNCNHKQSFSYRGVKLMLQMLILQSAIYIFLKKRKE